MKNIKDIIFKSSLYLLLLMFMFLIVTFTLFYLNISMSVFNPLFSILITTIIFYLIRKRLDVKNFKLIIFTSFIVLIFTILISTFIYDRSSDGNTYHKDAVSNLKNGWNVVTESSSDFSKRYYNKDTFYDMEVYSIWKDHYSKANWVMEANIYSLTDNIESAKAINLLFMYILFGMSWYYFSDKLSLKKGLILSLILTFNPITSAQLFSFYNDQLGCTIIYALVLSLISIIDSTDKRSIFLKFYMMSLLFIIALNIKFNILGYGMVFTFCFMVKYLYDSYRNNKVGFVKLFKKLFVFFGLLFSISLIYIGYSTYITNFSDHGNPFFPVYGDNAEDIITAQEPEAFLKYNNFEKVFYALFSRVNNLMSDRRATLKIPFTIYKSEIKAVASIDTRIGGYGILYSGILVLSILFLGLNYKKIKKEERVVMNVITLIILFITFFISEGWWARYNPTIYLITIMALYVMFKYDTRKSIVNIFTCIVSVNTLIILILNTGYTVLGSYRTNRVLFQLRGSEIEYNLNYGEPIGILSNLDDFNIKYNYTEDELHNNTYFKFLNYRIVGTKDE